MTKLEQAARQALEALGEIEWSNNSQWQSDRAKTAITALREALEAAPQPAAVVNKPVSAIHLGWDRLDNGQLVATYFLPVAEMAAPKLNTTPQPARQPLTDTEIQTIWCSARNEGNQHGPFWFARAIEKAHGIGGEV